MIQILNRIRLWINKVAFSSLVLTLHRWHCKIFMHMDAKSKKILIETANINISRCAEEITLIGIWSMQTVFVKIYYAVRIETCNNLNKQTPKKAEKQLTATISTIVLWNQHIFMCVKSRSSELHRCVFFFCVLFDSKGEKNNQMRIPLDAFEYHFSRSTKKNVILMSFFKRWWNFFCSSTILSMSIFLINFSSVRARTEGGILRADC